MILSKFVLSFIRIVTSIVTAVILLIVCVDEKDVPKPDGAEIVSQKRYTLLEYEATNQGLTNDGTYFYFSGKWKLAKASIETGKIELMNTEAIPEELQEIGCDHIGGLSYYNGIIYAAIEDGPDYGRSFIGLYDAETLEFTGRYYEVPHELHLEGVPWCAVDVENNMLYTAEWSHAKVLNRFNLDTMELVDTLPLTGGDGEIDRIQGGEMHNGKLYLACDEENDQKRILTVDVKTGKIETAFTRNIGVVFEAEDMTVLETDDGPIFYVLDRGERRKTINLTGYKMTELN